MKKGIVVSPTFYVSGIPPNLLSIDFESTSIDPVLLRHYLLYWDKIDVPDNNRMSIGLSDDMEYLRQCGILQRTQISFRDYTGGIEFAYVASQAIAAEQLSTVEPGQWAFAQSGRELFLPSDRSVDVQSLAIGLYGALPTPDELVPFDDILEFKNKYADELSAFRICMDELYLNIIDSQDIPVAKNIAIEKLERAISDINNAAEAKFVNRLASAMRVDFDIASLATAASMGAISASVADIPLAAGAAVGAMASVLKIGLNHAPSAGTVNEDFAYLCHVKRELEK